MSELQENGNRAGWYAQELQRYHNSPTFTFRFSRPCTVVDCIPPRYQEQCPRSLDGAWMGEAQFPSSLGRSRRLPVCDNSWGFMDQYLYADRPLCSQGRKADAWDVYVWCTLCNYAVLIATSSIRCVSDLLHYPVSMIHILSHTLFHSDLQTLVLLVMSHSSFLSAIILPTRHPISIRLSHSMHSTTSSVYCGTE